MVKEHSDMGVSCEVTWKGRSLYQLVVSFEKGKYHDGERKLWSSVGISCPIYRWRYSCGGAFCFDMRKYLTYVMGCFMLYMAVCDWMLV